MTSGARLRKGSQGGTKPGRLRIVSGRDSRGGQAASDRRNSPNMNVHGELGGGELSSGCRCKAGVQGDPSGDLGLILKTMASRNGLDAGLTAQFPRRLPIWRLLESSRTER